MVQQWDCNSHVLSQYPTYSLLKRFLLPIHSWSVEHFLLCKLHLPKHFHHYRGSIIVWTTTCFWNPSILETQTIQQFTIAALYNKMSFFLIVFPGFLPSVHNNNNDNYSWSKLNFYVNLYIISANAMLFILLFYCIDKMQRYKLLAIFSPTKGQGHTHHTVKVISHWKQLLQSTIVCEQYVSQVKNYDQHFTYFAIPIHV